MNRPAPTLDYETFLARWKNIGLTERQSYQPHFADVCRLVGHPEPVAYDKTGTEFAYEYGMKKTDGRQGYADVFFKGHFAIEYKKARKYRLMHEAYTQLLQYRENLYNPPLLIVTDIQQWEIHTNFTNTPTTVYAFKHEDLAKPYYQQLLYRVFYDPSSFHPEQNKLQITEAVAAKFSDVVDNANAADPERLARYLTQLIFGMFVEDIGLMAKFDDQGALTYLIKTSLKEWSHEDSGEPFMQGVSQLFSAMNTGARLWMKPMPYFNGSLFNRDDSILFSYAAISALDRAAARGWTQVEPTIFGTIFERTFDQKKRAQLGAHYTSPDDILLIVEPVLMQPLRREWDAAQAEAQAIRVLYIKADTERDRQTAEAQLIVIRARILERVRTIKVLDPACGSGNFLYMSLRLLLELEKVILISPLWAGLPTEKNQVHPRQLYGIEINEIAHALANIVVWIGYLQWRWENGYFDVARPVLTDMSANIVHRDAILAYDADGKPTEPEWESVDVIVGNPPFLGGRRMRFEMADQYVDDLHRVYQGRVSASADLVTHWFERARVQLEQGKVRRVGLLATNSIRDGENRRVLERIVKNSNIFMAWSDREWLLEGAALNVSMIGFDNGDEKQIVLDGSIVDIIHPDLTTTIDLTSAASLKENQDLCFLGVMKAGPFDIDSLTAQDMIQNTNSTGLSNVDVVKHRLNGEDITGRRSNRYIIDFGIDTSIEKAALYELPFGHVTLFVKPARLASPNKYLQERWWLHGRPSPLMRAKISPLTRYIATPEVAKYRLFVWVEKETVPDHTLHIIAREDDYFFGILHSRIHELWSLRVGSTLEDRPRYTSTKTFRTFPFPFVPGREDFNDARVQAISAAAKQLHEERHAWLNPPPETERLQDRTLTNLYNALQAQRGMTDVRGTLRASAVDFAPRLLELHNALDAAVCAAYGWSSDVLTDDGALLTNLLALNAVRAATT